MTGEGESAVGVAPPVVELGSYSFLKYRAEGNKNLVIVDTKEHKVYRCLKVNAQLSSQHDKIDDLEAHKKGIESQINFCKNIMQPLIGKHFVCPSRLVELPLSFVPYVNEYLQGERPAYRLEKGLKNLFNFATEMPDVCFLPKQREDSENTYPNIAVEIKPKAGLSVLCHDKNTGEELCEYCLHQQLFVKEGKWKKQSQYCPLKFFSGNVSKMKESLLHLIDTPQNNLRVFLDGELVYGTGLSRDLFKAKVLSHFSDNLNAFCDVLLKAILHVPDVQPSQHVELLKNQDVRTKLPVNSILYKILQVQQINDESKRDILKVYEKMEQRLKENNLDRKCLLLDELFIEDLFTVMDNFSSCSKDSLEYMAYQLHKFMISKSAKDCQIMITLQPVPTSGHCAAGRPILMDSSGNRFYFSTSVIDLDPKPLEKIPLYYKLEQDILQNYMSTQQQNQA